ncbi:MAG: hypothetical protein OXB94_09855 [Nitrospira sp.]|nr:hypothetical protein [Nitrospira sp.]
MKHSIQEHEPILKDLSNTILDVCRESVTLIKQSDPAVTTTFSQKQEWEIYLEFLKVLFNLVDRVSAFHVPIQQQPEFMNGLEDYVSERLKILLAPSLSSSDIDDQEIVVAVGQAVAESREMYEPYKFVCSEDSKERNAFFQHVGERVAGRAGDAKNQAIVSTTTLCISAVLPALTALFEGKTPEPGAKASPAQPQTAGQSPAHSGAKMIKLISVVTSISGEEFETRWGLLPQFRRDLKPDQVNALTDYMNRVARIVGDRFAIESSKVLGKVEPPVGNA